MTVPEASMNKDHFSSRGKDEIGFSGKVSFVQTEPVPHAVSYSTYGEFWSRIAILHRAHYAATVLA